MYSTEMALNKAKDFVNLIILEGVPIEKAFLFGSYSKNETNSDSDIDVALISSFFTGFGFEDRKYFSNIITQKPFLEIETKTYSSEYFLKGDPFTQEILKTGINIIN